MSETTGPRSTEPGTPGPALSGVRRGPLLAGERVTLRDPKGRRHSVLLTAGASFHTTKGGISHDELIGGPEGVVVRSVGGVPYLATRPLLAEFTSTMPRGAAVVYPKDAAQIIMGADVFPGAVVVEAGAGSGALTLSLLRAVGPTGGVLSFERREDFAAVAERNVTSFLGERPTNWELRVSDLVDGLAAAEPASVDRVVLDMLAPWECVDVVADALIPGGLVCAYVATTTQLGRTVETIRAHTGFTEPESSETTVRPWHVEGLSIRPAHGTVGHTGFLAIARRLAPGVVAPPPKRRPAPGAYGVDYTGPRRPGTELPAAEPGDGHAD